MPQRTLDEIRAVLLDKARRKLNPVVFVPPEILTEAMAPLTSTDRDAWAHAFLEAAIPYERQADAARAEARPEDELAALKIAYGLCWLGRYPAANSAGKRAAYARARANHRHLLHRLDPEAQRVEIPFSGRESEGRVIPAFLRRPPGSGTHALPTILTWGGIDTFKEERSVLVEPFLKAGFAVLAIDMPGTGESPVNGASDALRVWGAVFDWLDARDDVDHARVAVHGLSTGGYWATQVAHVYKNRIAAAINQGGCAHYAFDQSWIATMDQGEYALELPETLASAWGLSTREEWIAYAPSLSLLRSGVVDTPCAPMLLVNGVDDSIFPIDDMYLLLRQGQAKTARFYPGGHMGPGAQTIPLMIGWLKATLGIAG
ncbi:alpha/beta hydrolase family protein [Paraburkholderia sp. J12]|uniref:alpha/beta hydrolase family protein n=1 Tax=Paraburkholderia sp. J12 TaxID=2805432 RepID=UPI002ABE77E4|nr:alpha/beta fold hydrolase [Paraburkholderia sp. J12]